MPSILPVSPDDIGRKTFAKYIADCVVLTQDGKILLQARPEHFKRQPGSLNLFGGHVEAGEAVIDGLLREMEEELGARIPVDDVTFVGAVTEEWTGHSEIVHIYFWHDKNGSITGCYEGLPRYFDSIDEVLQQPKLMDYAAWALLECQRQALLK